MERTLRLSERLYAALIGLYPSHFRDTHADQMRLSFQAACREAYQRGGDAGLIALWLPTLFDLFKSALEERARQGEITMPKERFSALASPLTIIVGVLMLGGLVGDLVWLVMPSESIWEFFNFTLAIVAIVVSLPTFIATLVRFGNAASSLGRAGMIGNVIGSGGIILMLIVSIPLQILQPHRAYDGLNVVIAISGLTIMIGHVMFGIDALKLKLLPRWNVTPLLVTLAPVLVTVPLIFINPESEFGQSAIPTIVKAQSVVTGLCVLMMGIAMMGHRPAQEVVATA